MSHVNSSDLDAPHHAAYTSIGMRLVGSTSASEFNLEREILLCRFASKDRDV